MIYRKVASRRLVYYDWSTIQFFKINGMCSFLILLIIVSFTQSPVTLKYKEFRSHDPICSSPWYKLLRNVWHYSSSFTFVKIGGRHKKLWGPVVIESYLWKKVPGIMSKNWEGEGFDHHPSGSVGPFYRWELVPCCKSDAVEFDWISDKFAHSYQRIKEIVWKTWKLCYSRKFILLK